MAILTASRRTDVESNIRLNRQVCHIFPISKRAPLYFNSIKKSSACGEIFIEIFSFLYMPVVHTFI